MSKENGQNIEKTETLEEKFLQLEEMIAKMQEPGISLDDSFLLYQKGIETLQNCNAMLDEVEKKMQVLNGDGTLTDF